MTISARKTAPHRRIPSYYEFTAPPDAPLVAVVPAHQPLYRPGRADRDAVVTPATVRAVAAEASTRVRVLARYRSVRARAWAVGRGRDHFADAEARAHAQDEKANDRNLSPCRADAAY